jgi:hypothetical protein
MSTRVGTIRESPARRSIWPAAVIASLLMLSIAIGAFFLGRDQAPPTPKTAVSGTEQTVAANTPTELSGGIVGGVTETTEATEEWPRTADAVASERFKHQRI